MHLKKMKRMKLRMLMETRKRQSFCEEQIKEAFVKFDKMRGTTPLLIALL